MGHPRLPEVPEVRPAFDEQVEQDKRADQAQTQGTQRPSQVSYPKSGRVTLDIGEVVSLSTLARDAPTLLPQLGAESRCRCRPRIIMAAPGNNTAGTSFISNAAPNNIPATTSGR